MTTGYRHSLLRQHFLRPLRACLLALLWLLPGLTQAAAPVELRDGAVDRLLPSQWLTFYDPGLQQPSAEEVMALHESQWRNTLQIPFTLIFDRNHTLWFRFTLRNRDPQSTRVVLKNSNPLLNELAIYVADAGSYRRHDVITTNGDGSHSATLVLPAQSERTIYVMSRGFHAAYITLGIDS